MEPQTPVDFKKLLALGAGVLGLVIFFALWWLFFLAPTNPDGSMGWYLFAFATGLTMIVLPCTLPLAFVIVPLSMGKGLQRGLAIALSFGAGVALMLSVYGVLAALVGGAAIGTLGAPLEVVKNWVYFIAGIFALLFALGEIGLIKVRMPSYTGAAPAFIQHQGDFIKAFLLGLFLGNIGVGCPHPATPLLLIEIASSGDVTYGWTLFLTHAIGRIVPLVLLAVLAILGVNGLNWLVARKDKIEKATGWAMVFVAGFILVLGLFSHAWWVSSGLHTALEKVTQEHAFLGALNAKLETDVVHSHGTEELVGASGLFGLPLELGHWVLVALWIFPIWWWWRRERARIDAIPGDHQISEKQAAYEKWRSQGELFAVLSVALAITFIWALPQWFLQHASAPHDHAAAETSGHAHAAGTPADHPHPASATAEHEHAASDAAHEHEDGMMHDHDTGAMMTHEEMDAMMGGMEHDHDSGDAHDHAAASGTTADSHAGHTAMYHEVVDVGAGLAVSMTLTPETPVAGEPSMATFFVHTRPDNTPYEGLSISHEKYMHVVGVRDDLGEFMHVHPEKGTAGQWSTLLSFNEAGAYKLYVDVVDSEGMTHTFGQPTFLVTTGDGDFASAKKVPVEYLTNVVVGGYQVALEHDSPLVAGKTSEMRFTVHDVYGKGVELDTYLGVSMHVAAISADLTQYVHTHPVSHAHDEAPANVPGTPMFDESKPHSHSFNFSATIAEAHVESTGPDVVSDPVSFEVPFAEPGAYRVFAQFRPKGAALGADEAVVAAFFVNVEADGGQKITRLSSIEHAHAGNAMSETNFKVLLVVISLILTGLLSMFVYKKIQVE
ncbi:MAG: hypothetical protein HYT30_00120 [Parcubacteria group bacterium]|nr:hypothetical protein [Parcubacteria group bacterium]